MELSSLRYFLCVADQLNFSRASKKLYVSQPTLSYHISHLEKELNAPLFIRDKRKLQLTEAGYILKEEATKACAHVDAAIQRIAALAPPANSLHFGFLELLITPCFNLFVSPFLNENPSLNGVMERSGFSLLESLMQGKYDFVFTRRCMVDLCDLPQRFSTRTLVKDSYSIAVPANHPCASMDSISDLSPLNGSRLLLVDRITSGPAYDPLLKSVLPIYGFETALPDLTVRNMDELLCQVAAGRGISILPFYSSIHLNHRGAKLLRLTNLDCCDPDVVLVWDSAAITAPKQQFLDFIEANFPNPV